MNVLDQFVIPLSGLKEGVTDFTFEVDNEFFEHYENSEIKKADITVNCTLTRILSVIEIEIHITGNTEVVCDRCLDSFNYPLNHFYKLFLKPGTPGSETDADIVFIENFEQNFNMAQIIYEYINFSFPLQKIHPNDENGKSLCNKKMLEKLNHLNIKSNNDIDPRWEGLKKLTRKKLK